MTSRAPRARSNERKAFECRCPRGFRVGVRGRRADTDPLREELRLAQIDLYTHPFCVRNMEGRKRVIKLQEQVRKLGLEIKTPPPLLPPAPQPELLPVDEIVTAVDGAPSAAGRYRFTEHCVLPDHQYDVTGTCGENPEANDGNDRNLIRKGTNEPTFHFLH